MRISCTSLGVICLECLFVSAAPGCSTADNAHLPAEAGGQSSSSTHAQSSSTGGLVTVSTSGGSGTSTGGSVSSSGGTWTGGASAAIGGAPGAAMTGLPAQTWTWVPFEDAFCRDGSTTGIGVNVNPSSNKLMIFLEGGGACFNSITCSLNAASFDPQAFFASLGDSASTGGPGIFNRADSHNPVKDWSFVYVPYCTGDVHAGNEPNGSVAAVGPQKFVGYANIGAYLRRIVPTFASVDQVLLTGISAGGFGATANYIQVARAFGSVPVHLLDDSGPLMDAPYVPACLGQLFAQTWSLDKTMLRDCAADCTDSGHYLMDFMEHIAKNFPAVPMGLVDSAGDSTMGFFFGFGDSDCTSMMQLPASTFAEGLLDMRTKLAQYANFGSFIFPGSAHTTLEVTSDLDSRAAGGIELTSWIGQLLDGHISNIGP